MAHSLINLLRPLGIVTPKKQQRSQASDTPQPRQHKTEDGGVHTVARVGTTTLTTSMVTGTLPVRITPLTRIFLHRNVFILKIIHYLCNRFQVQILHVSEIDSLLVYQSLDFCMVQIFGLALAYPVQPLRIVLRKQTAHTRHLRAVTLLVEMHSHEKLLAAIAKAHNHVHRVVAVAEHRKWPVQGFHQTLECLQRERMIVLT